MVAERTDQQVCIVTGAARGLGKSIAEAYATRGAAVALVDVLDDLAAEAAGEIEATGARAFPVAADITDRDQVDAMVETVTRELGPPDVLVNNAATFSVIAPVWEADPDRWVQDIRVNLCGTFLVCRAVVKGMVARRSGTVVNVVSSGGVSDPHAYSTSYAASKTAVMRLTEGLAKGAAEHNVKVFAVGPPAIWTEMTRFIATDPGGRKWRPGFDRIFEEGRDTPAESVATFIAEMTSGVVDELSGRYFEARWDLEEMAGRQDEILEKDLYTLRIRGK
ncbi:MAG: SDR family oxidoreductase [Candidatus Latescibacteria bacterium]|nr:SDR family oxidoreductase [Candidatus Latescibacterota bacterium]